MGVAWSQVFPPAPEFTEAHIPPQTNRVFVVTGGYSGIGYQVSSILFNAGARVYVAGRFEDKARSAIQQIKSEHPSASGTLEFLFLDLSDLASIKASASKFASVEKHLHVLINNAGVALPPARSRSKQDYELMMATNCLGPLLFTQLLLPQLEATARSSSSNLEDSPVRLVWLGSQMTELTAPTGGIDLSDLSEIPSDQNRNYTNSKTGNYFLASEFARRIGNAANILSLSLNPGALQTDLLRHKSIIYRWLVSPLLYPARMGAYTELFAALDEGLSVKNGDGGKYIIPWGRVHPDGMRADIVQAAEIEGDGINGRGTGIAVKFWDWCEEQVKPYM